MEHRGQRSSSERRISHAACVARVHVAYEVERERTGVRGSEIKERAIATEKEGQAREGGPGWDIRPAGPASACAGSTRH